MAAIEQLSGNICPVIFVGDGRGGKSYLASRLVGEEGAFVSCDSAEPVTEGIDICISQEGDSECTLIVLDCEGGNNAMAPIRTLVNVFGLLIGTEVIFVANGSFTEQSLQTLCTSLAARSLIHLGNESRLPIQRLSFVVNKNTLRYTSSALEDILNQSYDDASRQELRHTVREAFPSRSFFTMPVMGLPDFEEKVLAFRESVLKQQTPLTLGGIHVDGRQLSGLMQLVVKEMASANEISFPSINRFVVLDGFLLPLTKYVLEEARKTLPEVTEFDATLPERPWCQEALESFDTECMHVSQASLVAEARQILEERLLSLWKEVLRDNEVLGDKIKEVLSETREEVVSQRQESLGGQGLLRYLNVTRQLRRVEIRSVVHRVHGRSVETSEWKPTGELVQRTAESAFEFLTELPFLEGRLLKRSPSVIRAVLSPLNMQQQVRTCTLKDGHFIWWKYASSDPPVEANGCINFLVHHAKVLPDPSSSTCFIIAPSSSDGWNNTSSFTGGQFREFYFDACNCDVSRDKWVEAIQQHIDFGRLAAKQLGFQSIVKVYRPKFNELHGSFN